jgi:hypothetical protein
MSYIVVISKNGTGSGVGLQVNLISSLYSWAKDHFLHSVDVSDLALTVNKLDYVKTDQKSFCPLGSAQT